MWWLWIVIGIVCMIIEIITPGFLFFSIGIGAIMTGISARLFTSISSQLIMFSITTAISFLLMKKFAKALLKTDNIESNIYALIGKEGIVTKEILPHKRGYVKVESEEWSAVSIDATETIPQGSLVLIEKTEGNKVIVKYKG